MKVEELIGSLQTFEMEIIDHIEERKKGIALLSNTSVDQTEGNLETNEESSEAIVLIGRQFNNILRKINGRCGTDVRNIPSDINRESPRERIDYKIVKEKVLNVIPMRDLFMSDPNVQTTSRIKRKVCQ